VYLGQNWKRSGNIVLRNVIKLIMIDMTTHLLELKQFLNSKIESKQQKPDKQTRKLLLFLFTSTRGGYTRLRIILLLLQKSYNTHQISQELQLDYKAVQHHMQVLEKNNLVIKTGKKYGAIFHLSYFLEIHIHTLNEAIDKLDRKINHKKVYS
jgi:DNA-binding transcriptional ArsR family regulator